MRSLFFNAPRARHFLNFLILTSLTTTGIDIDNNSHTWLNTSVCAHLPKINVVLYDLTSYEIFVFFDARSVRHFLNCLILTSTGIDIDNNSHIWLNTSVWAHLPKINAVLCHLTSYEIFVFFCFISLSYKYTHLSSCLTITIHTDGRKWP